MDSSSNNFSELGLCREILRAINEQGYKKTTPVQVQAIPAVLEGRDVLAAAQTGTGKTAAFTLPLLQRLSQHQQPASAKKPRALILVPTRELAIQVEESIAIYGRHLSLKMAVIYGGVNPNSQQRKLESGVDVVVATPGRLIDHMLQKNVGFGELEMVVIDEADRMLDMGFIADIRRIVNASPSRRQTLMFSATFLPAIKDLAADLLTKALEIQVSKPNMAAEKVRQVVNVVDRERKGELLLHLIETGHWFQLLVFTRTKHEASRLALWLKRNKVPAAEIHSDKSQLVRTRTMKDFKSGDLQVLVATDIAARGLDIEQLPAVINYELPVVAEDYVHRIGRTGRAGETGRAISLVCADETKLLHDIERLLGHPLKRQVVAGFKPKNEVRSKKRRPHR